MIRLPFRLGGLLVVVLLVTACAGDEPSNNPDGRPVDIVQSTAEAPISTDLEIDLETRDYVLGDPDAFVTVIMYGDFQCQPCAAYARNLEILRAEFPNDLRLIWRHLPDTTANDKADLALQAAEAAAAQDRFWEMHDVLFTTQAEWQGMSRDEFREQLESYADVVGLDVEVFTSALDSERYLPLVALYQEQASALEIVGIPTLLINGEPLNDRDDLLGLRGAIRLALLEREQFSQSPPLTIDRSRDYYAVIETERGELRLDLFEQEAPFAVNNFVFLTEEGWYDDTTFFLVIPEFYAQAGDPSETGRGNPGYFIPSEHDNGLMFDRPGLVAMSHPPGELERNGSQFFITYAALPGRTEQWDGQYTIFGELETGFDVLEQLTPRNTGDPIFYPDPPPGDRIISVRIEVR